MNGRIQDPGHRNVHVFRATRPVRNRRRTLIEELFRNRLELARQRLSNTDDSIYTTAIELGFRDPDAFAADFRRNFGVTPSQDPRKNRTPQAWKMWDAGREIRDTG